MILFLIFWGLTYKIALAENVRVAVAANFTEVANEIGQAFEQKTGHKALYSFGSTGQLFTQISQGAPFDIFLAADQSRPKKAVEDGYAVSGSQFTYAVGKIALYSEDPDFIKDEKTLREGKFTKIAIANPSTAPYGAAAVDVMKHLGLYSKLESKIVQGNNIAQTYQFVHSLNAEIGFVALSQISSHNNGSRWIIPADLYSEIAQDAVLLNEGENNEAALAFINFLKNPLARNIIEKYGYGTKQ
ncbi:MAG: molybdate ABC transporter substrate-binding protein [Kordiimonadaceae bacterium]|nr:molybdate ABC transporter substrate-binding protein [Kordiimonadaceae bacterium]